MFDQVKILFKSITGEKNTLKAIWKLIYTAIGYVSSFYAATVLLKNLSGIDNLEVWTKGQWKMIVIIGLGISCIHNRKKINCCKKVSGCDMQIAISVKDIFANREANSFVVPTNTFFRTKMQDEYISSQSVQGRFQLKYFKDNIEDLDIMIEESLKKQNIMGEEFKDCFGTVMKYPIGTVAKVDYKKKHFYFVAISDVNEYGKPIGQSFINVGIALESVIEAIMKMGHCDILCIPLMGSGRAAIQEATKEKVFQETVDYFLRFDNKIVRKLIISISPKDYLDGTVNCDQIEKYLDYRCEFR